MEDIKKGITSFQLKLFGIILMVFDHIGEFFAFLGAPVSLVRTISCANLLVYKFRRIYSYKK